MAGSEVCSRVSAATADHSLSSAPRREPGVQDGGGGGGG